eukprot:3980022-Lingulodinium_polyedra.AAC.1
MPGAMAETAMRRRRLARAAYSEFLANRQARLVALRRSRAVQEYAVGGLARARRQPGRRGRAKVKVSKGGFVGPAAVLARLR